MLTIEQLLKASDYNIIKNTFRYKLEAFESDRSVSEDGNEVTRALGIVSGGKSKRKVSVVSNDKVITKNSEVIVYCSCDYFVYNLETALVLQGAARPLHATGFSHVKNISMKPGLCPHLACLIKTILLKGRNVENVGKIRL